MNFESNEQLRHEGVQTAIQTLQEIMADKKMKAEDRLMACKIFDGLNDTLIKSYILSEHTRSNDKTVSKLTNQLDKLIEKKED